MYKCNDCKRVFDEPRRMTAEAFYDCSFDYSCGHYVCLCPYCESSDFKEITEKEWLGVEEDEEE